MDHLRLINFSVKHLNIIRKWCILVSVFLSQLKRNAPIIILLQNEIILQILQVSSKEKFALLNSITLVASKHIVT